MIYIGRHAFENFRRILFLKIFVWNGATFQRIIFWPAHLLNNSLGFHRVRCDSWMIKRNFALGCSRLIVSRKSPTPESPVNATLGAVSWHLRLPAGGWKVQWWGCLTRWVLAGVVAFQEREIGGAKQKRKRRESLGRAMESCGSAGAQRGFTARFPLVDSCPYLSDVSGRGNPKKKIAVAWPLRILATCFTIRTLYRSILWSVPHKMRIRLEFFDWPCSLLCAGMTTSLKC